jgi:hypothetical protein
MEAINASSEKPSDELNWSLMVGSSLILSVMMRPASAFLVVSDDRIVGHINVTDAISRSVGAIIIQLRISMKPLEIGRAGAHA